MPNDCCIPFNIMIHLPLKHIFQVPEIYFVKIK